MRLIWVLLRRNLRAFVRDRLIVFFTLLTPLIFIFLFIVFYRTMVSTQVKSDFLSASMDVVLGLCDSWLFASAVLLATFTSTLGMLNTFVLDRETGRFSDYLVSPVRRWQLTIGYILSTWVVSVVISSGLMLLGPLWALVQGQVVMGPLDILQAIAAIALSALVFASLNTLVATFITSWAAFGGYAIVMGASIGFLAFCYVPPVSLSQTVNTVLGLMVFAQGAALIRQPIMGPAIAKLMEVVPAERLVEADSGIKTSLAVTLDVFSHTLPTGLIVAVMLAWAVLLTALSSWRLSRVIH